MCLIDRKQFRVTDKNIPIYKVVENDKYSPYQGTKLHRINNPISGNCIFNIQSSFFLPQYIFEEGFYHAFIEKEVAEELIITLQGNDRFFHRKVGNYKIVTGYIPADTRYAIDKKGEICAKRMILDL